jgi:hypothetical protein
VFDIAEEDSGQALSGPGTRDAHPGEEVDASIGGYYRDFTTSERLNAMSNKADRCSSATGGRH